MSLPANIHAPFRQITVSTTARLHMGFYDLSVTNCKFGNSFGGIGLAIDAPSTQIYVIKTPTTLIDVSLIDAKSSENVANIVENIVKMFNIKQHFLLTVNQVIPIHTGLGSGTQLALAIGEGLNQLFDLQLTIAQIATTLGRGKRSGIGIGTFEQGGLLVDAGITGENLPIIALRQDFPTDWRILLIKDLAHIGVHGALESQAFRTLQPYSNSLRDMMFKHMVPALQRADLLAFGAYMQDLQAYNGAYFAPVQGGQYASQDVATVLNWLQQNGVACFGQSSWGPTGFAILPSQQQADALQQQAKLAFAGNENMSFQIVRAKNTGASVSILED